MRSFLPVVVGLACALAAMSASAEPLRPLSADGGTAARSGALVGPLPAISSPGVRSSVRLTNQPAVLIEFPASERPTGLIGHAPDAYAASYCRSIRFASGRAINVTIVPATKGGFAYVAIDRLLCFN